MTEQKTDYTPGDKPVPAGAIVDYFGSQKHGRYIVTDHAEPDMRGIEAPQDEFFPDGKGYVIWKVGVAQKMDNGHHSVHNVRRLSFRVVEESETGHAAE